MSERKNVFVSGEELEAQRRFTALLKARNDESFSVSGTKKTAFEHSYGCMQNSVDGEKIRGMLIECGYTLTDDPETADVVVLNTCAVRENAEDRVYGNVGALLASKRKNPEKIICICGCMVQQPTSAEKIRRSFPGVDIVMGTHVIHRLPQLLLQKTLAGGRIFELPESDGVIAEGLPTARRSGIFAGVPVSYGCNNFCTYCVVPHVRGRERSRLACDVWKETDALISGGARDITLLGQNVNSYGNDNPDCPPFPELLRRACRPEGEYRIRFMTSHPKDAGQPLFDAIAECKHAAKHLHLPVQSGSDAVLSRMNRRYTASAYLDKIDAVRRTVSGIAVTADIIVGFPGETEADFSATLDLVRHVKYDLLYMFIYSPRSGTPAASYPEQVPEDVKSERFSRLLALQESISDGLNAASVGSAKKVLIEEYDEKHSAWSGKNDGVTHFYIPGTPEQNLISKFVNARIISAGRHWVTGEIIK